MSMDLAARLYDRLRFDPPSGTVCDAALAEHFDATPGEIGDALAFLHDAGMIEATITGRTIRVCEVAK